MTTYTSNLRLILMDPGSSINTWGTINNASVISLVDQAIAGYMSIAMSDANYTLTASQGASDQSRNAILNFTGTLTATRYVELPASTTKWYIVSNNTNYPLTFQVTGSGGATYTLANGSTGIIYTDATNVYQATGGFLPLTGGTITGNLTVNGYASFSYAVTIVGTGGIQANNNTSNLFITGGNGYNQGGEISLNGPSSVTGPPGTIQFYTGTGGSNALAGQFTAAGILSLSSGLTVSNGATVSGGITINSGVISNKGLVNSTGPIITGTYTLTTSLSNSLVEFGGSGAYTVTLPSPATVGIEYRIWLNNSSTITLTTPSGVIAGYGGGLTSVGLNQTYAQFYYLASDGYNWWLQAVPFFNASSILSAGNGLTIVGTGGIYCSNSNASNVFLAGGTSYNQGGAITLTGPGGSGNINFYTGTGGSNVQAAVINANQTTNFYADTYFNSSYGPTSTLSIGYRGIPQNNPGSSYTAVLTDAGKHILGASGQTTTIPANSSVAYPIGTTLTIVNSSTSGSMSIAINTDTMYLANTAGTTGTRTLAPLGIATAIKTGSTTWIISGAGLT